MFLFSGRDGIETGLLGYVHTIPGSFCARIKTISDTIGCLFTHKNGGFGAISVTEQSCAATISKAESHIWDRCSYYRGWLFVSARKAGLYFVNIMELKQQRRRRLRKRHLKSEFALLQTLSRLFHLVYFVKCWQMFLELNSKGLYQSSGKEKESCCLVFPSSTKREIRHFHVVVVQRRLRNVQKKGDVRVKLLFCLLNVLVF